MNSPVPFRLTESVFPIDRNQFVTNAGQVPGPLAEPAVLAGQDTASNFGPVREAAAPDHVP